MNFKGKLTKSSSSDRPNTDDPICSGTDNSERLDGTTARDYRGVLLETLDRIGCGGVVLDTNLNVIAANAVAVEIARTRSDLSFEDPVQGIANAIQQLLKSTSLPTAENDWVTAWRNSERPIAILRIHSSDGVVLLLVDLGTRLQPSAKTLRNLFGLTVAESKLALGMATGSSPDDLAREIGVKKTTVRTQLASVFAKTQTSRQGELIALLARIAILPCWCMLMA
jgi:DNA-binding CsgD family transcriptional regulator